MLDEQFWKGLSDLIRDFCGFTHTVAGTSSTTVGALGGALWLALWSKFGSPMAPVLLAALLLGSLAASIVAYTPLGKFLKIVLNIFAYRIFLNYKTLRISNDAFAFSANVQYL